MAAKTLCLGAMARSRAELGTA